ncbi:hypothetical protein ACLMAL_00345 [Nocardia sp. CWNU-33]|uniref:hypothetical protein n=1 Tax=Nocardia sp. CWNU-33 TaxID=3392117 RepID=UPI00398EE6C8
MKFFTYSVLALGMVGTIFAGTTGTAAAVGGTFGYFDTLDKCVDQGHRLGLVEPNGDDAFFCLPLPDGMYVGNPGARP